MNVLSLVDHVLCSCTDIYSTSKQINLDYNKVFPSGNLSKTSASHSDLSKRTWITSRGRESKYRTLSTYSAALLQTLSKLVWQWLNDSTNSALLYYTASKRNMNQREMRATAISSCNHIFSNFHLAQCHPLLLDLLNQLEAVRLCHTQY